MKEHYHRIYTSEAQRYEALISREDCRGELTALLQELVPPGLDVVELGAGTGRLTRWLAPRCRSLHAFDASAAMLEVARRFVEGLDHAHLAVADHRDLPLPAACADLAVEGWAWGHLMDGGLSQVSAALAEAERVLRPGGRIVLMETLGTGSTRPRAPSPSLDRLYTWLEAWGFLRRWCRTDYRFGSMAEGMELLGFFFGEDMARRFGIAGELEWPECTGVWVR